MFAIKHKPSGKWVGFDVFNHVFLSKHPMEVSQNQDLKEIAEELSAKISELVLAEVEVVEKKELEMLKGELQELKNENKLLSEHINNLLSEDK